MSTYAVSPEGVVALKRGASNILTALESIVYETGTVSRVIEEYHDLLGPHEASLSEAIDSISQALKLASDPAENVAEKLTDVAEGYEEVIGNDRITVTTGGSSTEGMTIAGAAATGVGSAAFRDSLKVPQSGDGIRQNHIAIVNSRIASGCNSIAKELYDDYVSIIKISDGSYTGVAHYSPSSQSINMNFESDIHNPRGAGSTYLHETGHLLDDFAGNGHTWLSSDPEYVSALRSDVEAYIKQTMTKYGCSEQEAYDIISEELEGDRNAGVSDIFGSLTGCRCQGDWGHSVEYWTRNPSNMEKEAFANMFEAAMGASDKETIMKKFFPRAFAAFERIIKNR